MFQSHTMSVVVANTSPSILPYIKHRKNPHVTSEECSWVSHLNHSPLTSTSPARTRTSGRPWAPGNWTRPPPPWTCWSPCQTDWRPPGCARLAGEDLLDESEASILNSSSRSKTKPHISPVRIAPGKDKSTISSNEKSESITTLKPSENLVTTKDDVLKSKSADLNEDKTTENEPKRYRPGPKSRKKFLVIKEDVGPAEASSNKN